MLMNVVNKFPKWAKILLLIFGDAAIIYRIFLFVDDCIAKKAEKNVKALITAIATLVLCCVLVGFILFLVLTICDLVSVIKENKFSKVLA